MRFFNRNRGAAEATATHDTKAASKHHHGHSHGYSASSYSMAKRPSFGQWLKATWLDIITMIAMGAIGLGVYMAKPAPSRSFPVTFNDGEIVYPEFGYPLRKEIIPIWLAAFLASIIPIFIILCMQIKIRSFWDVNNAVIGLLYSLIVAAVFQVFLKWLIGGLRPHFLAVCQPDMTRAQGQGYNHQGFQQLYFTRDICTGDEKEINDSLESFPSGHTTAAFAGFVYLYFYLNAKLKIFANYHPAMWKLVAVYAPILGATLIGGALTIDEYHNWYDVFAGAVIGTVMAYSSYRMTYAAVWDWRYNHIPLNRGAPFIHDAGHLELSEAVFTRRAGWGVAGGNFGGGSTGADHHNGVGHNGVGHNGVGHNGVGHQEGVVGGHHHNGIGRRPLPEDVV